MSNSIFLSDDLLTELTGFKLPRKQIEWLTKRNYPFEINAANHPKVLKEVVLHRMGAPSAAPVKKTPTPKWKQDLTRLSEGNTS